MTLCNLRNRAIETTSRGVPDVELASPLLAVVKAAQGDANALLRTLCEPFVAFVSDLPAFTGARATRRSGDDASRPRPPDQTALEPAMAQTVCRTLCSRHRRSQAHRTCRRGSPALRHKRRSDAPLLPVATAARRSRRHLLQTVHSKDRADPYSAPHPKSRPRLLSQGSKANSPEPRLDPMQFAPASRAPRPLCARIPSC